MATEEPQFTFQLGTDHNRRLGKPCGKAPRSQTPPVAPAAAAPAPQEISEYLENLLSGEDADHHGEENMEIEEPQTPQHTQHHHNHHEDMHIILPGEEPLSTRQPPPSAIEEPRTPATEPLALPSSSINYEEFAQAYMQCAHLEARYTEQLFRKDNLHPSLTAETVLTVLDSDPSVRLSFPFMVAASEYVECVKEHAKELSIYSVHPDNLTKLILDQLDAATVATGTKNYEHFPLLTILLSGAFPTSKMIKEAGLAKLAAFGDYIDPANLIAKFASISFKKGVVEGFAVTKARAKALEEAEKKRAKEAAAAAAKPQPVAAPPTAAANQSPFMKKMLAMRAKPAPAAATTPAPAADPTIGLTPSISPEMLAAAKSELIAKLASQIKDKNPTISEAIVSYCAELTEDVIVSGEAAYFGDRLISALVDPAQASLSISDQALEPFTREDSPVPNCWIPFNEFTHRQRAALIIYILLNFYNTLFHTTHAEEEASEVDSFAPLALHKIAAQIIDTDSAPNPIMAMFKRPEAATPAPASTGLGLGKSNSSVPKPSPKPATTKSSKSSSSKKRKRSDDNNNNDEAEEGTSSDKPIKVSDSTTTTAGGEEKVPTPKAKRVKRGTVDASFFEVSADGNLCSYRPPSEASKTLREAITDKPQPIRMFISPDEALFTEGKEAFESAFNVSIDAKKKRPAINGGPHDFTLVFTDPTDKNGDENRYGSLQVTFVHFTGGRTGREKSPAVVATDSDNESDDEAMSIEEVDDGEDGEVKVSETDIAKATPDWKYYKPLYSDAFKNGGATTTEYRTYYNQFIRTIVKKHLPEATTLSESMVKLAKFNDALFNRQGNYNGIVIIIAHTARSMDTRENAPKIFVPLGRRTKSGISYSHLEDDEKLRKAMERVLHHSVRAYKPYTDPKSGTFYRSYIGSHASSHDGSEPRIYTTKSAMGGKATFITSDQVSSKAKRFAAVCLSCTSPLHVDDYAVIGKVPAFPIIRCAGCSPAFRTFGRSGQKTRGLGLCPNH